jgi:hypothetical protein
MGRIRISMLFLFLVLPLGNVRAQEKAESEIDIHSNVRLIEMPVPQDMPEEFRGKYQVFMQQLKAALKEKTSERSSASALTIQVRPGIKEVGLNKTKRPMASITAYKKDSKNEFCGDILLHSYATGETINKEEIEKFLTRQILDPLGSLQ